MAIKEINGFESPSSICRDCGICCNTIFARAIQTGDSAESFVQIGLQPLTDKSGACTGFALPCPLFAGDGCPIYSTRPRICREYRCLLLRETERGGISVPEARGIIKRALALRESVVPQLGAMMLDSGEPCERRGTMFQLSALVAAMMKPEGESFRRQYATALSASVSLLILLRRHFSPVRKSNME